MAGVSAKEREGATPGQGRRRGDREEEGEGLTAGGEGGADEVEERRAAPGDRENVRGVEEREGGGFGGVGLMGGPHQGVAAAAQPPTREESGGKPAGPRGELGRGGGGV
jgi:hypothetical protein